MAFEDPLLTKLPIPSGLRSVATLHSAAVSHWVSGRTTDAIVSFREITRLEPKSADAHHNLASALFAEGYLAEAAAALRTALCLRPSFEAALVKFASVMEQLGLETEAAIAFRRLSRVARDRNQRRLFLSKAMNLDGAPEDAEVELRRALAGSPNNMGVHVLLGQLLLEMGKFAEGEFHLVQALEAYPDVFQQVAASRRMNTGDQQLIEKVSGLAAQSDRTALQRAAINFGLGKSYNDLGDYAHAMLHYNTANALRSRSSSLDRRGLAEQYDRTIALYDRPTPKTGPSLVSDQSADGEVPILILGMPRSGTTLIEQIVSSHPAVAAAGELSFWRDRAKQWSDAAATNRLKPSEIASNKLRDMINVHQPTTVVEKAARAIPLQPSQQQLAVDARELADAGIDYVGLLRRIGPAALRVTDKAPFNFERIGLIRSALPGVRIIHCRRQPVDNCLSIYFTNYKGRQAWTPADVLFQYRQYERLMEHWRKILSSDRFIEVDYEAIVESRESEVRRLIDFCGLPWDDACLAPEENSRVIRSASLWQARQSIYTQSVDRWKRYEPWLEELQELVS